MYLLKPEAQEIAEFEEGRADRLRKYPQYFSESLSRATPFSDTVLKTLDRNGYVVLPKALNRTAMQSLFSRMEDFLEKNSFLRKAKFVSALKVGEHWTKAAHVPETEMAKGSKHFRNLTNSVDIQDPLVNCPDLVDIALGDTLLDIATMYLGCFPALGYLKMRRSFVNSLGLFDTNIFHVDGNSGKILKAFLYLNDVEETGGPFCYVRGSHKKKFDNWKSKDRYTIPEIEKEYGPENMMKLTAQAGDVILADTSGFHRADKPKAQDRSIVILNYVVHEEYGGGGEHAKIKVSDHDRLTDRQKAAAVYLDRAQS